MVVLRWLLVLPAAYAAGLISLPLFFLMDSYGPGGGTVLDVLIAFGLSGTAFVVAGALVAPSNRTVVSIVLAIVAAALTGLDLSGALSVGGTFLVVAYLARIVGAGLGIAVVRAVDDSA